MTTVFESNHLNTIIETKWCWVTFFVQKQPSLNNFMRESAKKAEKTLKSNLDRNLKHITIVFDYNHFNTTFYTK